MPKPFDPDYGTALDAAGAIRNKTISSVELTQHTFRRIDAHQPVLNSFVYHLREQALAAAKVADDAIANGDPVGPLHGVPVNVKESFGVAGQPCTWGIPQFAAARAARNAVAVQRLLDSGAILLGATNVPYTLMDGQSFNDIYGRSDNPWDPERTPGGSSGGSAASLAAGMTFFSIGSDVGGSIRSPASFCGVYGHKPTLDIVPMTGHAPGGEFTPAGFSTHLAVAGPMARSAEDLRAGLDVLAGPEDPDARALRWSQPPSRRTSLREYRVGYVLGDPAVPVCAQTRAVLENAVQAVQRTGAYVREGWPDGFDLRDLLDCYYFHLGALDFSMTPPHAREFVRPHLDTKPAGFKRGALSTFADWQVQNMKRLAYRSRWKRYFEEFDVFLSPTTFTAAVRHDPTPLDARMIEFADGTQHPYWNIVTYICPATLTGCPATTAPVGLTGSGLPVGLQIMGPFAEDASSLHFAALLAREIGGFQAPPQFAGAVHA